MNDDWRMGFGLLVTAAFLAGCVVALRLLARSVQPAAGCSAAAAATLLWARLVRPMPGYVQGIVSLAAL